MKRRLQTYGVGAVLILLGLAAGITAPVGHVNGHHVLAVVLTVVGAYLVDLGPETFHDADCDRGCVHPPRPGIDSSMWEGIEHTGPSRADIETHRLNAALHPRRHR